MQFVVALRASPHSGERWEKPQEGVSNQGSIVMPPVILTANSSRHHRNPHCKEMSWKVSTSISCI
jgi:hypothetical protein